ncbi:MAG: adenylosuccinate lyase [bacterium]|nr:adenylosuccinate lyase [bacterium]
MISRYTLPDMAAIWSEQAKYEAWLEVELAVCRSLTKSGLIPKEAMKLIADRAKFDVARIEEIEAEVQHDVIAFLTCLGESIGPEARYLHRGMTSSDVLDTALALQLKRSGELLVQDLWQVKETLGSLAVQYKDTAMIGRTHGVHAEPITFGLKLARWYAEVLRQQERLHAALDQIAYGKLSGAVGTFAHLDPNLEEDVCRSLHLKYEPVSSQIVSRDRHAHWVSTLALIGASLEKFALEIRHLHRTEVGEVLEGFGAKQKGSSAMPHKRNPILCERLCGMARILRSYSSCALENVALWHERDISHSSNERMILPDSAQLLHYMLRTFDKILKNLEVRPEAMAANLGATRGAVYSEAILLKLSDKGLSRDTAYRIVQKNALKAQQDASEFQALLLKDKGILKHLSPEEIAACFDLEKALNRVDDIFKRVGLA